MTFVLPDRIHEKLQALTIPDRKMCGDQFARIQRHQISHNLKSGDGKPILFQRIWWSSPPGSVSLVYALALAKRFFVRVGYRDGALTQQSKEYDPTKITEAIALGTEFNLAVAKHIFTYFLTESDRLWQSHARHNSVAFNLENETQFIYGLWQGVLPTSPSVAHPSTIQFEQRLDAEAELLFDGGIAPHPHEAIPLTHESAFLHQAGLVAKETLRPTTPPLLQGGSL